MPLICYRRKSFRCDSRALIDNANAIIEEYQAAGYQLTLRQLYYQFVARDLLPNTTQSYDRLGSIINDARLDASVEVIRVALNMDQVRQYRPPPNPAKSTDSRFATYRAHFGSQSWELDALTPQVIDGLISEQMKRLIDAKAWERVKRREKTARAELNRLAQNWEDDE